MTTFDTQEILEIADSTAKRLLKTMVDENYIIAIGDKKSRKYIIKTEKTEKTEED